MVRFSQGNEENGLDGEPCALFRLPENVQGDFSCAAMYQNAIYLMSCKENLELFMASPQKYVCAVPTVNPKMKLLVVSPVLGGGETAAKYVSEAYNLKVISCQEIIEERIKNPGEIVFNHKIVECLSSGQVLPDDVIVRLIMQEIKKVEDAMINDNHCNGWVVLGCPLSKSQSSLLLEAG